MDALSIYRQVAASVATNELLMIQQDIGSYQSVEASYSVNNIIIWFSYCTFYLLANVSAGAVYTSVLSNIIVLYYML